MKQLFISYCRTNKAAVDELVDLLPSIGYQPWVDSDLHVGEKWWDAILNRIATCDAVVAIVSRDSLNSVACQRELDWASALGRPILPIAVEKIDHLLQALPAHLATRQILDWTNHDMKAAFAITGGLTALSAAPPVPDPLPQAPPAPLSDLGALGELIRSEPLSRDHEQQRRILDRLESALHSTDPDEQQGGIYLLEAFRGRRDDLYQDVYQRLNSLEAPRLEKSDNAQVASAVSAANCASPQASALDANKSHGAQGEKPFLMAVEDVFTITGRGTAVIGKVERGTIRRNDDVEIVGLQANTITARVTGIEKYRELIDVAREGDNVGLLLADISRDMVKRGQVLCQPGTVAAHTQFEAAVCALSENETGWRWRKRSFRISNDPRPQFKFRTGEVPGEVVAPQNPLITPDQTVGLTFKLAEPVAMEEGQGFLIQQRGVDLGGFVTKVIT